MAKYSFQDENFFARGRAGGAAPPSENLGTPHVPETIKARKWKLYTPFYYVQVHFSERKSFPPGEVWGCSALSVNLGPPHIS